jgi:membrane protease subunit (stomatin/prohibitin family)
MGLFDKLRGEFIDIIEWLDSSSDTIVYRFERYNNEIKNGAKLTVREGQAAVFINEGKIADVFYPGMYTLTTANLPVLSTLQGWKYGFDSPFKAEVYFVSTRNITAQKWGTKNPITLNDNRFGMIEVRAYGTYVIRVKDAEVFIREIVGTDDHFSASEISEQLKSLIVTRFTDAAGESGLTIENYASNTNEISALVQNLIAPEFGKYGLELTNFLIENVSMPPEIKAEIFELSRLNAVDLNKLTQMKAAKAIESAAKNDGGLAGSGMGLGIGIAMANVMGQNLTGTQQNLQQQQAIVPPNVPVALSFFAVLNGAQAGPYDMAALKQMAAAREITTDTLLWHGGLTNWTPAGQMPQVKELFGSIPPAVPGL